MVALIFNLKTYIPKTKDSNKLNYAQLRRHNIAINYSNAIPDGNMVVALTTFGGSILLTGVVGTPVVLVARNSSVLVEPLPDCAPVCEETDKGLERPDPGGVFVD